MVGIFDTACALLPPWTKELYLCTVASLLYLLCNLLPPPPLPKINAQYIQITDSVWLGKGVMNCTVDQIVQEFYSVSDQIQNLQNSFTNPNKNDQLIKTSLRDWGL
jgi:hypothetical protein